MPEQSWTLTYTEDFKRLHKDVDGILKRIMLRGVFYYFDNDIDQFECVVDNMIVYHIKAKPAEEKLVVFGSHPYVQTLKHQLITSERVNIKNIGRFCTNGISLEKILERKAL